MTKPQARRLNARQARKVTQEQAKRILEKAKGINQAKALLETHPRIVCTHLSKKAIEGNQQALTQLTTIATKHKNPQTQQKATIEIGYTARNGKNPEITKQSLQELTQIANKHPNPQTQKHATKWIGITARNGKNPETREQAKKILKELEARK